MTSRVRVGGLLGTFFSSLVWSLNLLLFLYTLLLYYLLYKLPIEHWSAGLLLITMPVAWIFNIGFILFWLVGRSWRALLSTVALLAGFMFWQRTLVYNAPETPDPGQAVLKVLSFNTTGFDSNDYWKRRRLTSKARQVITWSVEQEAPIKCFQEFYSNDDIPGYRVTQRLRNAGYSYYASLPPKDSSRNDPVTGVAIFSRYPIIKHGGESFHHLNGILWADIKAGNGTIRIINVHLHSMGIRVRKVLTQKEMAGVKEETKDILSSLKEGFVERRKQVRIIEKYISQSPYPVLVLGDFNETPYSVVYERLRRRLRNAYEDGGRGFQFTLNRAPRFIRIDNQFYSSGLKVLDFITYRDIPYSDHFPIMATYRIQK
ncbi:endonuclease/exonuclease/phosphatase family protein [Nibrella saemangeumensis]|uniref:Endonuclease/exonuclease/phosphatase family protein n=1 Tax=Nibrella saemangeumensis TaxID=1084526 RepID=A0ABP8MC80_9BACT